MQQNGFRVVPFSHPADIYVVNTCSVTDHADKKCARVVRQALKISPTAHVVVVGCYAQLKPAEIAEIPGVDLVLGAAEKFNLPQHLETIGKTEKKYISSPVADARTFHSAYSFGERTRTFLKVQDGCDYSCSFCTIPLARGKSRSDTIAHVVEQARRIASEGVAEIVLTGVNTGDFGKNENDNETFFDLISELDQVEGIERFRISSIEPNLLSEEIIDFVAGSQKFVPHFHIPLQSGSNKILGLMRRRYRKELYASRVAAIKNKMPHCCIGVDVITGFPGETHEDFLETYSFLNELPISYLHVFTYSERPNTAAIRMQEVVPQQSREERTEQLRNLSEKKRRYFYGQFTGTMRPVLFEEERNGDKMLGFTDNYIRVEAEYDPLLVNTIAMTELLHIGADGHMVAGGIYELPDRKQAELITHLKTV